MKVLVLAAGRSIRMKPVEDKNFLSFLGKPLILRQVELILKAGFNDIIVVGGKHNLKELSKVLKGLKAKIKVIEQKNLDMGMCGAVLSAKDLIEDDGVFVFSSNDVVDEEAFELIKKASEKRDAESFILGKIVKEYFPGGYLKIDKNCYIHGIVEKPEPGTEPSNMVNLVLHVHKNTKKLIKYLERVKSDKDDKYEIALSHMMNEGSKMKVVKYDGYWQPIKYPWHIKNVFEYFFSKAKKNIDKSANISKDAVIKGDVIIGKNVKIFEGAIVNGPCYIGDNSVIANNALVRESHIGENCVIGYSTEVARSFLGHDVWTHSNYIGDSIIGNNVSFGAGSVTGNLRLDEKNIWVQCEGKKIDTNTNKLGLITGDDIRVGINASFMPGVTVGSGTFIGACIPITENLPEDSFVRGEVQLKISKNTAKADAKNRNEIKNKLKNG